MKLLVTGGLGFIGSAVVRHFLGQTGVSVLNLDKMTYAANAASLLGAEKSPGYRFEAQDICDSDAVQQLVAEFRPDAIIHLAAESHVDRSIDGPGEFIQTNVVGTYVMLQAAMQYWQGLDDPDSFRFLHVSTDEVFGSLGDTGKFTEETPYQPNSPYSASKAGADHLVRAWHHTYGLPTIISN
ncbi:MAG: dTDP-glucose 4,6-dehydratase, partial [Gammaproteobacteria bacterium]